MHTICGEGGDVSEIRVQAGSLIATLQPSLLIDRGNGQGNAISRVRLSVSTLSVQPADRPPGRADLPALTPVEAGTRFSDPGGCKAELT